MWLSFSTWYVIASPNSSRVAAGSAASGSVPRQAT
jgi:hypothetical protein